MNVTGSAVGLLEFCGFFARDDVPRVGVRPPNKLGDRGTAGHATIEGHYDAGKQLEPRALAEIVAHLPAADRRYIAELYQRFVEHPVARARFRSERAFAYRVADSTSRPLVLTERRGYAALIDPATEIASTLDLVNYQPSTRTVHVGDIKLGAGNEARGMLANAQLRFNALSAARAYGAERAMVTELHLSPDGVDPHQWPMEAADLDAEADKIRALVATIPNAEPQPGDHCRAMWCPLRGTCPATLRWQAALVPLRAGSGELSFTPTTAQHFALSLQAEAALRSMADWLKAGREAAVNALPGESVELPDGRRYERREKIVRSIDLTAPGASDFLRDSGVGDAILEDVTLGRLEAALRAKGYRGGEVDRYMDTLLAGLDSLGALIGAPTSSYEVTGKRALVATPREIDGAGEQGVDGYPLLRI